MTPDNPKSSFPKSSFRPGLVSITFRQLSPREVVQVAREAKLKGIEWGGDVHVPPNDLPRAHEVSQMTRDAGLQVAAYGSYFRLGQSENAGMPFAQVLETARELGAPSIRVWAGTVGSAQADATHRALIADDARRVAQLAQDAGIVVALEYHGGTLTDTAQSARELLEQVNHPNLKSLWQPPDSHAGATEQNLETLRAVEPWGWNLHVFQWLEIPSGRQRRPLSEGASNWKRYLDAARDFQGGWALLEFVCDDDPTHMAEDAAALRGWLGAPQG